MIVNKEIIINTISNWAVNRFDESVNYNIFLIGSYAKNIASESSDIDIVFDFFPDTDKNFINMFIIRYRYELQEELQGYSNIPFHIHLYEKNNKDDIFYAVNKDGILIFKSDESKKH